MFVEGLSVGPKAQAAMNRAQTLRDERPRATKFMVTSDELEALVEHARKLLEFAPLVSNAWGKARTLQIHGMMVCTESEPEGVDLFEQLFKV